MVEVHVTSIFQPPPLPSSGRNSVGSYSSGRSGGCGNGRRKTVAQTGKWLTDTSSSIVVDNRLNRDIGTSTEKEKPDSNEGNVDKDTKIPAVPTTSPVPWPVVGTTHPQVSGPPKDEAEETVEQRGHQTEKVAKEGDDLGNDECKNPEYGEDGGPSGPANDSVGTHVSSAREDVEEHEASAHGGVENSKKDERGDHEAEANDLKSAVGKGTKGWRSDIVCADVGVGDGSTYGEDEDFGNGDGPKSFGEVPGFFHLSNEGRKGDLANECVANVEESAHSHHKCRVLLRNH